MMTVGELIDKLQEFDKDTEVVSVDCEAFSGVCKDIITDVFGETSEYVVLY